MNNLPQTQPKAPILLLLALFGGFTGGFGGLLPAVSADEPPAAPQEAQNPPDLPAADEILNQARTRLEGLDSLECDLQQTAMIGGMKILATGRYTEASGNRVQLLFRMYPMATAKAEDLKAAALDAPPAELKPEDNSSELLQVSDGTVVFTSWKNGDTQRVTRRNLRDIQTAAASASGFESGSVAMDLGVGGLRSLISRLQSSMVFAPVRRVTAGDRTLLEVTGRWSDRVRRELFGLPENTFVDARPWVPEYCRVYVDQETMLLRRIQYLKHSPNPADKLARPLLTLDLRNLKINGPVDDALFRFTPPENTPVEDQTDAVIQAIRNPKSEK
jgi:hypothetical protein